MFVEKKYTTKQLFERIGRFIRPKNIQTRKASDNMKILKDVHIPMRDGGYLCANLYIPNQQGKFPVILCLHPGGKDLLWKDGNMLFPFRMSRVPGHITISDEVSFEAPDPDFWTCNGYVTINIDKRGFGNSPRAKEPQMYWSKGEIEDIYDAIEWAGVQSWSNGNVGMLGVSYLAINQYQTAALQPPHLKAICPWEGVSDLYKDMLFPGGVREIGFAAFVFGRVSKIGFGGDFKQLQDEHPLRDDCWKAYVADYSKITLPILNCLNFSTQLLHAPGTSRIFRLAGSKQKWLYTHNTGEWTAYYSPEANAMMIKFFDYFLKGFENGMLDVPKVRLEIREFGDKVKEVRYEEQYPPNNVKWTTYHLNNRDNSLSVSNALVASESKFDLIKGSTQFSYIFDRDTEIVGPMKLTLYIELENCDDANIFAGIQKFHNGKEVNFEGTYGFANDIVSKSCLRVALRTTNEHTSLPYLPDYDFDTLKPLKKGEIAKLEFRLADTATYFRKGDELRLTVQGCSFISGKIIHQPFAYPSNKGGRCKVYTSAEYPSQLLMPVIEK